MAFPDSFLQELSHRNDIVDVVSSYVRLGKRTGGSIFGLCPFHSEKTPSFSVRPDKQMYHCFGCGKGGSVVNFIMDIENLGYADAVHFLAKRAGLSVPEDRPDPNRLRRQRMLELNRRAAMHFFENLKTSAPPMDYIAKRRISPAMVKRFGLGYAPDSWDNCIRAMSGFSNQELVDAGLAKIGRSGKGMYDAFRNRLIFPVIDVRGDVIGFSGRIMGDGEPKYLNSPETLVFNKSRNLFGLNLAKKSKIGYIILAEGNIDVIALHEAGFDSAVASLGTSLTSQQALLLSRYTSEVVIAYDSDNAGIKASQRAIGLLEKLELKVRVLRMDGAKDPDEYIRQFGKDAFANLLAKSENHIDFRLRDIAGKYDLAIDEQKVSFLTEAINMISSLKSSAQREVYSARISETAGISKESVDIEVARTRKKLYSRAQKKDEREFLSAVRGMQPKAFAYGNPKSAAAEEGIIRLIFRDPSLISDSSGLPGADEFSSAELSNIYSCIINHSQAGEITAAVLSCELSSDEMAHFTRILNKPETLTGSERALSDYIRIIRQERENNHLDKDLDFKDIAERIREKKGYGGLDNGR